MSSHTALQAPDWRLWQAMLDGKSTEGLPVGDGILHQGYWHDRYFKPVAIWYAGPYPDGCWIGFVGHDGKLKTNDLTVLNNALSRILQVKGGGVAVTKEAWLARVRDGVLFPEETGLREKAAETKATDPVTAEDFLQRVVVAEKAWTTLNEMHPAIKSQEEYEKFSELYARCMERGKQADAARKAIKEPLDAQVKVVQDTWQPIVNRFKVVMENARMRGQRWQNAEKARLAAEHAEKVALAAQKGELAPDPEKRDVGAIKSRKAVQVAQITDWEEAALFLARMNDRPSEFTAAMNTCMTRLCLAGVQFAGTKLVNRD